MKITFIARYFPEDMKGGGEKHIYELWKRTKQVEGELKEALSL